MLDLVWFRSFCHFIFFGLRQNEGDEHKFNRDNILWVLYIYFTFFSNFEFFFIGFLEFRKIRFILRRDSFFYVEISGWFMAHYIFMRTIWTHIQRMKSNATHQKIFVDLIKYLSILVSSRSRKFIAISHQLNRKECDEDEQTVGVHTQLFRRNINALGRKLFSIMLSLVVHAFKIVKPTTDKLCSFCSVSVCRWQQYNWISIQTRRNFRIVNGFFFHP